MSDSIVEFLRARLNEDAQHARNATPGPWDTDHVRTRGEMAVLSEWGSVVAAYAGSETGTWATPEPTRASAGGGAPEGGDRPGGR